MVAIAAGASKSDRPPGMIDTGRGSTRLGDSPLDLHAHPPHALRRVADALVTALLFAGAVFVNTSLSPAAPAEHLYYLPIVFAAVRLGQVAALLAAGGAVVEYHLVEVHLAGAHYDASGLLQLGVFFAAALGTARIARDARRMRVLASTDDLTGLMNLRAFEEAALAAIEAAKRDRSSVAILSLDVDRLKSLNDTYGHLTGADAVRTVGRIVGAHLPAGASACRFGGDEFFVVLPGYDARRAGLVAGDIDAAVAEVASVLDDREFPPGTLSVSVGSAASRVERAADGDRVFHELLRDADAAMYEVKRRHHAM